jgi:putative endonuclease
VGVFYLNPVLAMNQFFVYIISNPEEIYYKGFTTDMKQRLALQNEAEGKYSSGKRPWRVLFLKSFEGSSQKDKKTKSPHITARASFYEKTTDLLVNNQFFGGGSSTLVYMD